LDSVDDSSSAQVQQGVDDSVSVNQGQRSERDIESVDDISPAGEGGSTGTRNIDNDSSIDISSVGFVDDGDLVSVVKSIDNLGLDVVDFENSPGGIVRVDSSFISNDSNKLLETDGKRILVVALVPVGLVNILVTAELSKGCAEAESEHNKENGRSHVGFGRYWLVCLLEMKIDYDI